MTPSLRLVFVVHNHQPVGNFDGVFEQACRDAYDPFLDAIEGFPDLGITMHISGSLLEWLERHHVDYINRVRRLVAEGRVEIIGGPYFEPILAAIPAHDRQGQIRVYSEHLEHVFETSVRGMWVPERVWEQNFTSDIVDAGIEYTILDDSHFRWAGFSQEKLHGYYLTENEGRLLSVFPDDETLRYIIPWSEPEETIAYLRKIAEQSPGTVVSFGDDGEKFGSWPGTFEHVYGNKNWLRKFFTAIQKNSDWLSVVTMAQAVDSVAPRGKVYLPNASYREMTEWALPSEQQQLYQLAVSTIEATPENKDLKPFIRAGFWRNFLVKYPESNEMYSRALEVSRRLEALENSSVADAYPNEIRDARMELYRGQCNCPFWHGAFGGLYLPHLRNAIYKHLIAADSIIEKLEGRTRPWVDISVEDYNLDARKEVRVASDKCVAYLAPARGGHLYEFDIRATETNLLATLNRRPEPYHQTVLDSAGQSDDVDDIEFNTHEGARFKQPGLDQKISYDRWPRKSLVDHFLRPGTSFDDFKNGNGNIGDFLLGVYETKIRRSSTRVEAIMVRQGRVGDQRIEMTKIVALDSSQPGQLEFQYKMSGLPVRETMQFAVEFNLAGIAAGQPDRYFYSDSGEQLGQLEVEQQTTPGKRIGAVDEWLGLDVALDFSRAATVWTFPIQTVSQSEGGFELVHQSSAVVPMWMFQVNESRAWETTIRMSVDTSISHARQLAQLSAHS